MLMAENPSPGPMPLADDTLALVAATALAGAGRVETGAWHAVAGIRLQDAPVPR